MKDKITRCAVNGCERGRKVRDYCQMHYARWRRTGDTGDIGGPARVVSRYGSLPGTVLAALVSETDECIVWPHGKVTHGYGAVTVGGRHWTVHRLVALIKYGEPPSDRPYVCHKPVVCHNTSCINYRHLYYGSPADNMADKRLDGTHRRSALYKNKP